MSLEELDIVREAVRDALVAQGPPYAKAQVRVEAMGGDYLVTVSFMAVVQHVIRGQEFVTVEEHAHEPVEKLRRMIE